MLGRYEYLYHTRHAKITFLVAVVENEIAGYLIYKTPPGEEEPEEWNPTFPDGTNSKFFELIFGKLKVSRAQYNLKNHWELESLAVDPKWQRKGVGGMLVKKFLELVDDDHANSYVHASKVGKPLYEKFGFKAMGVVTVDLAEFDFEPYTTWDMQRVAV